MRYVTIAYYIVLNVTMCLSNNQVKLCLKRIAEEYFIDDVVLIIFWKEEKEPFKFKKLLGGSGVSMIPKRDCLFSFTIRMHNTQKK